MQHPSPTRLSKSRFCSGLQCERQLWWRTHEPDAPELAPPPSLQAVYDRGHRVGELARLQFPGGVLVDGEYWEVPEKVEKTRRAIADGAPAIFEAAFVEDGVFVAVDVMERGPDGWTLVEVKSTLSAKPAHIPDVAIQLHVVRKAGLTVPRAEVMHLDRECTFPDLSNLFTRSDVILQVAPLLPGIAGEILRLRAALAGPLPEVRPGLHCTDPYECPFLSRCVPAEPSAASIGLEGLVVAPALAEALRPLAGPIAFLDFETVNPAIPAWNGCHPYEAVPVQMSCHVKDGEGGLSHHAHLAERGGDPRPALARAVVDACRGARTVLAYGASFERRCLLHLARAVPEHADALEDVIARLHDLLPIVRRHVRHPGFGGSFGLKTVTATLLPDLAYDDLEIGEGGTAAAALEELLLGDEPPDPAERDRIRTRLLDYCRRDTLVMVRLLELLGNPAAAPN